MLLMIDNYDSLRFLNDCRNINVTCLIDIAYSIPSRLAHSPSNPAKRRSRPETGLFVTRAVFPLYGLAGNG